MKFSIANVYAFCDSVGQKVLWGVMGDSINNDHEDVWCILDDFNVICSIKERRSRTIGDRYEDLS